MKKLLAVLLCLLTACSASPTHPVSVPATRPVVESPARQSLILLVDSVADTDFSDAAEVFASTVSSLTDGKVTVEVRNSVTAVADYHLGEGDLVFVDSRRDSDFSADLAVLSEPLRYSDYNQFTMALNSQRMLGFLDDGLADNHREMVVLATFYLGTDYFVTARPLSRGMLEVDWPQEDIAAEEEEENLQRPVAALRTGSKMAPFMEEMGLEPVIETNLNARIYNVVEGSTAIAELSLDEMLRVDWQDSGLNLIHVGHSMTPGWLVMNSQRWQSLPDVYQAVVQEAISSVFPVVDGGVRARQDAQIAAMRAGGVTVDTSFSALQNAATAVYAQDGEPSMRKKYLLQLLTAME